MSYTDQDFETAASHTPAQNVADEVADVLASAWQYDDDAEQENGNWTISAEDYAKLETLETRLDAIVVDAPMPPDLASEIQDCLIGDTLTVFNEWLVRHGAALAPAQPE